MDIGALPDNVIKRMAEFDTPFFLFDLDKILVNINRLYDSLNPDQIFFALKSNSLPPILKTISEHGCGFEINNIFEFEKAITAGAHPSNIINSSPITSALDVRNLYANGVDCFTFDSKDQIQNLKINAPGAKTVMRLSSTNEGSRFNLSKNLGVDPESSVDMLSYAKASGLRIYGLTFHVGSQCHSPPNWHAGIVHCAELFKQSPELEMINIGGGFPVRYNGSIPDITYISQVINQSINNSFEKRPTIYVEPGRFIVGNCALACASVTNIHHQKFIPRAAVDLSVFGGLIEIIEIGDGFQYPIETTENGEMQSYRIIGATCAGNDVIAEEIQLPRLKVDLNNPKNSSRIYLLNTGAYTLEYVMTARRSGFNGLTIPRVYCIKNGEIVEEN
jgi:ornithine decarboxylase